MARPVETAFAYFPLDCTFFSNDKVKALRRAYGSIGVLTYIYILCNVYGNGYYYKVKSLNQFAYDVAESIANKQLESVAARVRESIDYMADGVDLIDRSCLDMGILTSKSIQEQYSVTIAKFKRKTQIKEYNLLTPIEHLPESTVNSEETTVNSEETSVNSEITHEREREKEIENMVLKGNINTTHTCACAREVTVEEFEKALECVGWEKYPNGEVYAEIRTELIGLINGGEIALSDLTRDLLGQMLDSMYIGRERRNIFDLRAYLLAIVNRTRRIGNNS